MTWRIITAAAALAGCDDASIMAARAEKDRGTSRKAEVTSNPVIIQEIRIGSAWARGCVDAETVTMFDGRAERALLDELGEPSQVADFRLGEETTEFRVELLNQFPLPANADRIIRERTWATGECRLIAWLANKGERWIVAQAMRWPAGTAF